MRSTLYETQLAWVHFACSLISENAPLQPRSFDGQADRGTVETLRMLSTPSITSLTNLEELV